jgi:hypothetical protein
VLTLIFRRAFYVSSLNGLYVDLGQPKGQPRLVRSCLEENFVGEHQNITWSAWLLSSADDASSVRRCVDIVANQVTSRVNAWADALESNERLQHVRESIGQKDAVNGWVRRLRLLAKPEHFNRLIGSANQAQRATQYTPSLADNQQQQQQQQQQQ